MLCNGVNSDGVTAVNAGGSSPPPLRLSPLLACDPATAPEVLWFIAEHEPELRRWLVANPSADAALLEYVAQAGGPGVNRALTILLDGLPAA